MPAWGSGVALGGGEKKDKNDQDQSQREPPAAREGGWQEGAGGLLLLAGAGETGVLPALEQAVQATASPQDARLARATPATRRQLVLTLLFLSAVGLRRTWDLRGYTGAALALLTGRRQS